MSNYHYLDDECKVMAISLKDYSRLPVHIVHYANEIIIIHDDDTFSIMKSRYIETFTKRTVKVSLAELTELINDDKLLSWFIQKYKCNGIFKNEDFLL